MQENGTSIITKDFSGNIIGTSGDSSTEIIERDYQTMIQNYAMPYNFSTSLHMIAQDVDFMQDVIKMAIGDDSSIELTYVESSSTTTETRDYSGHQEKIYSTLPLKPNDGPISIEGDGELEEIPDNQYIKISNDNIGNYYSPECYQRIITTHSGSLYVTKADTWLKSIEKKMEDTSEEEKEIGTEKNDLVDRSSSTIIGSFKGQDVKETTMTKIFETITTTSSSSQYTMIDENNNINVDKFVELIKSYPKVRNNLETAPSNMFYLLQQNENTQKLEQIMRYVISQLNGVDYGVSKEDLEYLLKDSLNYVSASNLLREYIRYWEHSSPPPTNEDGTCYIIENDGVGNAVVGYGVDIENGGYKHLFIENGYPTEIGGEVPIEFVDSVEEMEINDKTEEVKAMISGLDLTGYQMNALVSRAYNCGSSGAIDGYGSLNFVEAYKRYWNQEKDSKFEEKDKNADFTHELYKQFMSTPVMASGTYLPGLERRRKSEWTLFQTGYYDVLDRWHSSADSILQVAEEIHKYMEENNYTYSLERLNTTFEASKTGFHSTCCATFISWVLQDAGYISYDECPHGTRQLTNLLKENGWTVITNISELQPGDVLYYKYNHVEIYAGDNTTYNAGSTNAIQNSAPANADMSQVEYGLRAPE